LPPSADIATYARPEIEAMTSNSATRNAQPTAPHIFDFSRRRRSRSCGRLTVVPPPVTVKSSSAFQTAPLLNAAPRSPFRP